jgi:hypothetical protein
MRLPDGTIVPHYMSVYDTSSKAGAPGFFDEVAMLVGEVTEILYPDDPRNSSKKTIEYVVNVWRRQGSGAQERLVYRCYQSDTFGSIADWFRFSFRESSLDPNKQPLANGATVFVVCINGDRSNAYIIGAMPQPNRKQADPNSDEGRFLRSRFNGVEVHIADDGSFELLVPGATTVDGDADPERDANNHGSKVSFAANGDIIIDDQNGDSVTVSPGAKTISIESGTKLTERSQDVARTATTGITDTAKTVQTTASKSWRLKAPTVVVESPNVSIGGDGLNPTQHGVVLGGGIDTFTGLQYSVLRNASTTVKAKE